MAGDPWAPGPAGRTGPAGLTEPVAELGVDFEVPKPMFLFGKHISVKSSLEKLNVPAWYRDRQERAERRLRHESGESVLSSRSLGWRCGSGRGGYKRGAETDTGSQQTSRDNSR